MLFLHCVPRRGDSSLSQTQPLGNGCGFRERTFQSLALIKSSRMRPAGGIGYSYVCVNTHTHAYICATHTHTNLDIPVSPLKQCNCHLHSLQKHLMVRTMCYHPDDEVCETTLIEITLDQRQFHLQGSQTDSKIVWVGKKYFLVLLGQ